MKVILTATNHSPAQHRAGELASGGFDVVGCQLDVASQASVNHLRDYVAREFGHLDVLVNNASGAPLFSEQAATADLAAAKRVFDVTVFGSWRMIQAFIPLLRKSSHPRVVNVSSGAGSHGDTVFGLTTKTEMGTSYAAAKAALNALTIKFARQEESRRLLINTVCPGLTSTFESGSATRTRSVADAAASVVWAALLDDAGPTGGFFRDGKPLPW